MLAIELIAWWYGKGWIQSIQQTKIRLAKTASAFSLDILLRTLFAPWKRITTTAGSGLDAKMQALLDNLISRVVGFTVRLFVLFSALIILAVTLVFSVIQIIVWPFVPLLLIFLIIRGIA